jgi:threonine/homoserine/homoserine lactone efflux protein
MNARKSRQIALRSGGSFVVNAGSRAPEIRRFLWPANGSVKGAQDKMDGSFFLRGLLIGFSIAAVVGPIGMLCIQRSLQKGFVIGLATGMGAATADGIYGGVAAFGLTIISTFLVAQQSWIRLIGGVFLLYLGIKAILTRPTEQVARAGGSSLLGLYASTLLLTLTNPLTILSFATVFAALGVGIGGRNVLAATLVTLGVFSGSSCWWLLLSGGAGLLRERLTGRWLIWMNRLAGIALLVFGIIALMSIIP